MMNTTSNPQAEYHKPASALNTLYQDTVEALRVSPKKIRVVQSGSLKDIAKKILEKPTPHRGG